MVEGWEARLALSGEDAEARFQSAREIAQRRGFAYVPLARLPELPDSEIVARVAAISGSLNAPDMTDAAAILGAVEPPSLTVTKALDTYWKLAADRIVGKSADQVRRWENPRKKAVANFVEVVGDLPLNALTRAEFLSFREWLLGRVQDGKITAGSANKDITHLGDVLRTVDELKGLGLDFPMHRLALKEGEKPGTTLPIARLAAPTRIAEHLMRLDFVILDELGYSSCRRSASASICARRAGSSGASLS